MVMDQHKSKQTRSYGETCQDTHASRSSAGPSKTTASGGRSTSNDQTRSAPVIPQRQKRNAEVRDTGRILRIADPDSKSPNKSNPSVCTSTDQTSQSVRVKEQSKALQPCRIGRNVEDSEPMPEVSLAVLGAAGVGKSTFVQCALDLKQSANSPVSAKKMSLNGVVYLVRLLEVQLDAIDITADQHVRWPKTVGDQSIRRIDGALTLYDVMNEESIAHVPELINAFSKSAIPCVLVSCKCDNPPDSRQLDPRIIEQVGVSFGPGTGGIDSFQTSANLPESQKRCISVILRTIMSRRSGASGMITTPLRKRASTSTQACAPAPAATGTSKHSRAGSELLGSTYKGLMSGPGPEPGYEDCSYRSKTSTTQAKLAAQTSSPVASKTQFPRPALDGTLDESVIYPRILVAPVSASGLPVVSSLPFRTKSSESSTTHTTIHESFLNMDDGQEDVYHTFDGNAVSEGESDEAMIRPCKDAGCAFDELVDRLLSQPMSKSDAKYSAMFLCLYRKFAAPADLLMAIIDRFESLDKVDNPQMLRISSQLRNLSIMAQWVAGYPGDFAHPLTRRCMTGFIAKLASNRVFAVAAKEMGAYLEVVSDDDDTDWACSDASSERTNTKDSFLSTSSVQSSTSTLDADSSADDIGKHYDCIVDGEICGPAARRSATSSDSSIVGRSASNSNGSVQTLLNTLESAQRQAQLLIPVPKNSLTKTQWHQFMETSDEDIARELTRIDWIMFSSIRPRDLVRHVSSPADRKGKSKSLEHVNRMIGQFNHVAYWVTNVILLREKPKHRAKALEKFMGLAWKLRYLNNYSSLGAVIAGINGSAVLRLTQTRELVTHQAQKDFMRLEILMGTQKSHFAYRLAWENTSSERIPFLPLHRRDLVSAEQGNRTFIGDKIPRINWKKFEVMGEVIVGIQKSQGTPYPNIAQNEEIQRLVLESRITTDDDELYERSIQLEAPGGGENTKKKFGWFQR